MSMNIEYRPMTPDDYQPVIELWRATPGVDVTAADSKTGITAFLERNPDLSLVAIHEDKLVAALLCGHDGRRGFMHHLVVVPAYRRMGIARELVDRAMLELDRMGLEKCHLFIRRDNLAGLAFWKATGWTERVTLTMASRMMDAYAVSTAQKD